MAVLNVIQHTEIGSGGAATWEKTSISTSYDHLWLQCSLRSTTASSGTTECYMRLNSDAGYAQYSATTIYADSSGPSGTRQLTSSGDAHYRVGYMPQASELASTFNGMSLWIPNYANTDNFKQCLLQAATQYNHHSPWIGQWNSAMCFRRTAAISAIKLWPLSGSFAQYSTMTLYGVNGA